MIYLSITMTSMLLSNRFCVKQTYFIPVLVKTNVKLANLNRDLTPVICELAVWPCYLFHRPFP